jgi:hypothetical protein
VTEDFDFDPVEEMSEPELRECIADLEDLVERIARRIGLDISPGEVAS